MFNGVIYNLGVVKKFLNNTLIIQSNLKPKIGASIAVNGACMTVTKYQNDEFEVSLSKETRDNIALENLDGKVHLEEAMRLDDRFNGHIVQGHIDCIGVIKTIQKNENGIDMAIAFDESKYPLITPKGSIAIDGISLTINDVNKEVFWLTIIPHTFSKTLFHTYKIKRRVNIETDIFNRSIYHMLQASKLQKQSQWDRIDSILYRY